jgi:hypothetical protein
MQINYDDLAVRTLVSAYRQSFHQVDPERPGQFCMNGAVREVLPEIPEADIDRVTARVIYRFNLYGFLVKDPRNDVFKLTPLAKRTARTIKL